MSNILIDTTIQDNAIKSNYEVNHKLTPIALPHSDSDHDESSNKSKKSRRFILNNMQAASPKLKSSYDSSKYTIKEMISLYQSLSDTDKTNFITQNYADNQDLLYEMYLKMPINDSKTFLEKAATVLSDKITIDYANLSTADKKIVGSEALKMIQSFVNSMPKDKRDEFTSKFNTALKKFPWGNTSAKKVVSIDSELPISIDGYNSDFMPHAIPIMALIVKAFVDNMNTESLDELEQIMKADMINNFLNSVKNQITEDISKYKGLESTASSGSKGMKIFGIVLLVVTIVVAVAAILFTGGLGLAELAGAGEEAGTLEGGVASEMAEESEMETFSSDESTADLKERTSKTTDDTKSIKNADKWYRKGLRGFNKWGDIKTGGIKAKLVNAGKILPYAAGAYGIGYVIDTIYGKNGQVKQQAQLGEYQTDVQASTVQSDTLNNSEQTASKRIDDDSQRVSQSSGYCQQAINMLAQAMSMRA